MKRKITLLMVAACSIFNMNAQSNLSDDFTATWNPNTLGWVTINNCQPVGSTTVFQGNGAVIPAYNGGINDYVAMNYQNTSSLTAGGISTWLITPSLNISNGSVLEFATRRTTSAFPDRLQVRMSPTNNTVIPTGTASIGTYTTLLLDINPLLATTNASAVSNNSVNGYPQAWVVYTINISGLAAPVNGRFAFRYFVSDGGGGANSDYIGIDAVRFTDPCSVDVPSYTTCAGASSTIQATGGSAATSFSWNTGATTSSIVVSPASTTVYTLFPSNGTLTCNSPKTATITIANNLGVSVSASSSTVCSGNPVTISAVAAANTFSWNTGATTPVITVTPATTTTYSVGALNGGCFGGNSITIVVNASPSLSVSLSPSVICTGGSITINASGASTYTYLASSVNPQTIASPTAAGAYFFTCSGTGTNGCTSSGQVNFTVEATPNVIATISKTIECINKVVTVSGGGASTYSWSGASSSSSPSFTFATGTTAGAYSFSVVGTETTGCSAKASVNLVVVLCTGVEKVSGNNSSVSVFPNPFSNEISVNEFNGTVAVYNSIGQLVINQNVSGNENINTTELLKGAYIVKLVNAEGAIEKTIKLIKN